MRAAGGPAGHGEGDRNSGKEDQSIVKGHLWVSSRAEDLKTESCNEDHSKETREGPISK
jgi:hypothetical protein